MSPSVACTSNPSRSVVSPNPVRYVQTSVMNDPPLVLLAERSVLPVRCSPHARARNSFDVESDRGRRLPFAQCFGELDDQRDPAEQFEPAEQRMPTNDGDPRQQRNPDDQTG